LTTLLHHKEVNCGYGCHAADWLAAYDLCLSAHGGMVFSDGIDGMKGILQIAQSSGWWWPLSYRCILTEHPILIEDLSHQDGRDRFGLVIEYSDGWGAGWLNGVIVPAHVVSDPETISVEQITTTPNVEVRRVMIERYGIQRYLMDSCATSVHQDDYGSLYRIEIVSREPIVMVRVLNSTPEKDGSFKDYFLRVPPNMQTARQAVAWTFGKHDPEDYAPTMET